MATVYYPDHVPGKVKLARLLKMKRDVVTYENSSNFAVHSRGQPTCFLPGYYLDHMNRFIWREEAIRLVLQFRNQLDISDELEGNLKMVLWYMDDVFDRILAETEGNSVAYAILHSDIFDSYSVIEFFVRRHEPKSVVTFRRREDINLDRARIDDCDWKAYEVDLGGIWTGARMAYRLTDAQSTLGTARKLFREMKNHYDPPLEHDEDYGYVFTEHLETKGDKMEEEDNGVGESSGAAAASTKKKGKGKRKGRRGSGGEDEEQVVDEDDEDEVQVVKKEKGSKEMEIRETKKGKGKEKEVVDVGQRRVGMVKAEAKDKGTVKGKGKGKATVNQRGRGKGKGKGKVRSKSVVLSDETQVNAAAPRYVIPSTLTAAMLWNLVYIMTNRWTSVACFHFGIMSDMYWPKAPPTPLHIDYIAQVQYSAHPVNSSYFEVKETNLHNGRIGHRVNLPEVYRTHFIRLLWRLSLVVALWNEFGANRKKKFVSFRAPLLRLMVFLDNVIEATIRPALIVDNADLLEWTNPNFEDYLAAEFLLGRHEPFSLREFRLNIQTNIEKMCFDEFDWEMYESRVDPKIEGRAYEYNIAGVPSEDMENLWTLIHEHYNRKLDFQWISRWVDMEGGEEDTESSTGKEQVGEHEHEEAKNDEDEENNDEDEEDEDKDKEDEDKEDEDEDKEDEDDEDDEMVEKGEVGKKDDDEHEESNDQGDEEDGTEEKVDSNGECVRSTEESMDVDGGSDRLPKAVTSQSGVRAAPSDNSIQCNDPSPPPPNQLMMRRKRPTREEDEEDAGMPSRKRSTTPAAPVKQGPPIVAFDPSLFIDSVFPRKIYVVVAPASVGPLPGDHPTVYQTVRRSSPDVTQIGGDQHDLLHDEYTSADPPAYHTMSNELGGTEDKPELAVKDIADAEPVKRPRGRPKGSTKKGKKKEKEINGNEFITTDIFRTQGPSLPGSSTEHAYEMVRVVIAPLKNPPVFSQQSTPHHTTATTVERTSTKVQAPLQATSSTTPDVGTDTSASICMTLVDDVQSIAEGIKHSAHGVDGKARSFDVSL
ncbi:hypothetical protein L210DRAFT_934798 [Boletus edulis BED1]|uniref:Uncharacterized protein n=1 Tax=Boletus edulis BED1 TaxID=1328754 RepID=A0AAD4BNG4_BOLED|nr:hypothetical protein L210DRAFT_934798 [Boletus edulis BED1]